MREIKFRAWDNKDKQWLEDYEFDISPNGIVFETDSEGNSQSLTDIDLMQYTGLKANGVEIYEGDIVQFELENKIKLSAVEYVDAQFLLANKEGYHGYWGLNPKIIGAWNCEVKGNVYENQELLEANNE